MSLITRYPGSISISDMILGEWEVIDEKPSISSDSWDGLTVEVARLNAGILRVEDLAADFEIGQQLGLRSFFFQSAIGPICKGGGIWTATLNYKGLAGEKPVVVDYGSSADEQSGENVITPDGLQARVSASENTPTASARYITLDADAFDLYMEEVGATIVPPKAPGVAASVWDFITDYTYHYPYGWVLVSRTMSRLPGANVGLVQDSYKYKRKITP